MRESKKLGEQTYKGSNIVALRGSRKWRRDKNGVGSHLALKRSVGACVQILFPFSDTRHCLLVLLILAWPEASIFI